MQTFKLNFYTKRWNSDVALNLRKTALGWHISHIAINGDTEPDGSPILYSNLHQDNVRFPYGLDGFVGYIWEQLDAGEIDEERAQEMFDELGEWVSTCEKSQPIWKVWNS